ncbi:MAG TPA: nodulation protein NfeD [Bryobacteraceae bacterium]|nr:nodulation protein NfeD [Bryobacteraceae bacterium]
MRSRIAVSFAAVFAAAVCHAAPAVIAVSVDSIVHPVTVQIIENAMRQADRERAGFMLIRLNTPGGLMDATRRITAKLIASPVPVVTFVTPSGGRAASAGFFILEAGDIAAMAAGTNAGAASPVLLGQQMDPVMRTKVENDASAALRTVVMKRGRNAELAEKAVREAKSFTETEALTARLIDIVARDENDLLAQLNGREVTRFDGRRQRLETQGARVIDYELRLRERIISAIADPNIAFLLLILGLLGIYTEFTNPGLIAPGVIGGIAFVLALSALSVLPVHWTGVVLLVLALALFILEAKFTSHGILGIGGAVAMVLGATLLVEGPPEVRIRLSIALAVSVPFAAVTVFLATIAFRARENKVITGREGLIDAIGVARTALAPGGKIFVQGEYWDAVATRPVEAGARVRVTGIDGLRLRVEPLNT